MRRIGYIVITCLMVAIVGTTAEQYQASWESLEERVRFHSGFRMQSSNLHPLGDILLRICSQRAVRRVVLELAGSGTKRDSVGKDQVKPNETLQYHLKTFGPDVQYHDFARMFKAELFKPEQWAEIFRKQAQNMWC